MTKIADKFLVVAASCRSIARSIIESGHVCEGIDLFADQDSLNLCPVLRCGSLTSAIKQATRFDDEFQVVIGAGIDNRIIRNHKPFGPKRICGAHDFAVKSARDPVLVADCLKRSNIPVLQVQVNVPAKQKWESKWIEKPIHSGGGHRVRLVDAGQSPGKKAGVYYQQFIEGPVFGASFVADENHCHLIGVCRQDFDSLNNEAFIYHGSIGPTEISSDLACHLTRIGSAISEECRLNGWFGVDFVLSDGLPWVLEVNPRFTSSMEIHERQAKKSLFGYHLAADRGEAANVELPKATPGFLGKRYLYNRQSKPTQVTAESFELLSRAESQIEEYVTDIPATGTLIRSGSPICTVWARGENEQAVKEKLLRMESDIMGQLT